MKSLIKPIPKIPVLILTGFLGSGKTTLLNSLLTKLPRSAVIINEFGTTPIDPQLLREHNIPLSTLSGGCLCCQVRDALAPVLKNLRMNWESKTEKPFDRIIIETSGVANPEPVLDVLLKQNWLSSRYRLQGVIATISALNGAEIIDRFPEAHAQIAWADIIAVTHTDLTDINQLKILENRLSQLSPAANRLEVANGEINPERLLVFPAAFRRMSGELAGLSGHGFNSVTLQFDKPLLWDQLKPVLQSLISKYGDKLVRVKGLIFDPTLDHPLLVQAGFGILHPPTHLPARESDDFMSRLVFIMAGSIDGLTDDMQQQIDLASA
jgi:G3E family GTPase